MDLMQRRRELMMMGGEMAVNLFEDADLPHGRLVSPTTSRFAEYALKDTIPDGTRVRIKLTFASGYESKTSVYLYNSSATASASRVAIGSAASGILECDFDWHAYGTNSYVNIISWGGSDIPIMAYAELYII